MFDLKSTQLDFYSPLYDHLSRTIPPASRVSFESRRYLVRHRRTRIVSDCGLVLAAKREGRRMQKNPSGEGKREGSPWVLVGTTKYLPFGCQTTPTLCLNSGDLIPSCIIRLSAFSGKSGERGGQERRNDGRTVYRRQRE